MKHLKRHAGGLTFSYDDTKPVSNDEIKLISNNPALCDEYTLKLMGVSLFKMYWILGILCDSLENFNTTFVTFMAC